MSSYKLAVIPGDGIGPEVVAEGLKVLDVVAAKHGLTFAKTEYELGAKYWHKTGETLPDSVMAELAQADVILLGAVGDPTVPSGVLERGLLLKLRFAFDHYINLRPTRLYPALHHLSQIQATWISLSYVKVLKVLTLALVVFWLSVLKMRLQQKRVLTLVAERNEQFGMHSKLR